MKENKKSGGGDVRAEALAWGDEWDKAKYVFFGFLPLAPTVGCFAPTHIPRLPKKKPLRGKKVGFAEKNCAYSTQDSVVFVDKWVDCLFGCLP